MNATLTRTEAERLAISQRLEALPNDCRFYHIRNGWSVARVHDDAFGDPRFEFWTIGGVSFPVTLEEAAQRIAGR